MSSLLWIYGLGRHTCMGSRMSNQQRAHLRAGWAFVGSPTSVWPPIFMTFVVSQYFQGICLYFPNKLPESEQSAQNLIRQGWQAHTHGHTPPSPPPAPLHIGSATACILLQKKSLTKFHSHIFLRAKFLKIADRKINPQAGLSSAKHQPKVNF